jgi:hypothetical protein
MSDNFPLEQTDVFCETIDSKQKYIALIVCSHSAIMLTFARIKLFRFSTIPSRIVVTPSCNLLTSGRERWHYDSDNCSTVSRATQTSAGPNKSDRAADCDSPNHRDLKGDLLGASGISNRFDVYRKIIGRISEGDRALCLQMLRWVSYAARPLSASELLSAVNFQTNSELVEEEIEKISCGLLNVSLTGRVNLLDLSLRDYLNSQSVEGDVLGWVGAVATSHEMIATNCLRLLQPIDLLEFRSIREPGDQPDSIHGIQRQTIHTYAREFWRFHYIHAEQESYCLPGMVHGKLRDGWHQGDETFVRRFSQRLAAVETKSPKIAYLSDFAFLEASLREGAKSGMVKLVKLELEMGASPNAPDILGMTPLDHAAAAGSCAAIKTLLDYGANANTESNCGETAFFHAIANARIEAVKFLQRLTFHSADAQEGTGQNRSQHISSDPRFQKLSLVVSIRSYCSHCDNQQIQYLVSTTWFFKPFVLKFQGLRFRRPRAKWKTSYQNCRVTIKVKCGRRY